MTQHRTFDFHAPRTGALLNEKMRVAAPAVLSEEMAASKGTADFDVTLGAGGWISHEGIAVVESASLANIVTLADPDDADRIDVICGTLTYEADTEPTPATYAVLQGTPGANPTEPACSASQVKLVTIYVPTDATDLGDCFIRSAGALRAWLSAAIELSPEASVFKRAIGDPFLVSGHPTLEKIFELGIKDGDLWVEIAGLDLYIYDATANEWVSSDILTHAPTHKDGGTDELDVGEFADVNEYLHVGDRGTHEALAIRHSTLGSIGADDHHAKNHKATHSVGAVDPVDLKDIADVDGYRHKTHAGYAPSPHGSAHHNETYSMNPHDNADHLGTIAAGFIGGGSIISPAADTPIGANVYQWVVPDIAVDHTTLKYTALRIELTTAPSAGIVFTFKRNGGALGAVTVAQSQTVGTAVLDPTVSIVTGDIIQLDDPADVKGAKGLIPSIAISRIGVVV